MQMVTLAALYDHFLKNPAITTDTRLINPGDIFFALKGPNFNGNAYAAQALKKGAAFAVIDEPAYYAGHQTLLFPNVLETLQQLAGHHRRQLNIPIIAVTGSNGKTTTKELIHAVLSTTLSTSTTYGNLNNHIGIPVTLLRIAADAQIAVIEMGANHQGEIAGYCAYTRPTHGIITNCGKAHLEGFGGVEGVRKGKGELFEYLKANKGSAFICSDFEYFEEMAKGIGNIIWYGTTSGSIKATVKSAEPFLSVEITAGGEDPFTINTRLVGAYNIYNVLAACAVGIKFGVSATHIQKAVEAYNPTNSRSQLMHKNGNTIVLDAYNANPSSMAAAINNFASLAAENKILMLGAMAELGEESMAEHKNLVQLIHKHSWKQVLLVGGDFANVKHPWHYFNTAEAATEWWKKEFSQGNTILVKGSRSYAMEKLVEAS